MREHLFRGKQDKTWYYGDLYQSPNGRIVFIEYYDSIKRREVGIKVDPETIGEYTGISDKNDKKVFEGDIFELADFDEGKPMYGVVKYRNTYSIYRNHNPCGFVIEWLCTNGALREDLPYWCEDYSGAKVIGNIHDNPNWRDKID